MAYPPYLLRHISFRQQETTGAPISTSAMDAEENDQVEAINQINRRLRLIQDAAGSLINVASQISQALVGTDRLVADGVATVFVTTIPWDTAFSSGNVLVVANGETVDPTEVTVADDGGGFLEVTLLTAPLAGWVLVAAYSEGAGIAARLADASNVLNGAVMVGVYDIDGHFVSTNVEGALAELAAALDALTTSLGIVGDIWTKAGLSIAGDPASADWDLGGFRITNIADAVDPQDVVSLAQLQSFVQNLDALLTIFIRADGAVPFTADQSMDGNQLTDVGAPTAGGDAANKTYVDGEIQGALDLALALDGLKSSVLRGTLTGPVDYDQSAVATADADQITSPATVVVPTFAGVAKPGAADHVANKQYVDEEILDALGGAQHISPYAEHTVGDSFGGTGEDGAIVNVGEGGIINATTVAVGVAQNLDGDLYLFATGNVSITANITLADADGIIEIQSAGDITISATLTARDIRLRAAGDVIITGAGVLAGGSKDGVVAVNAVQAVTFAGAATAALIFCYAVSASTVSGTMDAALSNSIGTQSTGGWAADLFPGSGYVPSAIIDATNPQSVYYSARGGEWGNTCGRRNPSVPALIPIPPSTNHYLLASRAPLVDYITPFSGIGGDSSQDSIAENAGAGGGTGPAGAGTGGATLNEPGAVAIPPKQPAVMHPCRLVAAPGGGGGAEWSSAASPGSAPGGQGGGVIVVQVQADLVLTGAVLTASGLIGGTLGNKSGGGGGGGTVKVSARGTLTDGTFDAGGGTAGAGGGAGSRGRPGGGGKVLLAALAYAGAQVIDVANGADAGSGLGGATAGASEVLTLSGTDWDILYNDDILGM